MSGMEVRGMEHKRLAAQSNAVWFYWGYTGSFDPRAKQGAELRRIVIDSRATRCGSHGITPGRLIQPHRKVMRRKQSRSIASHRRATRHGPSGFMPGRLDPSERNRKVVKRIDGESIATRIAHIVGYPSRKTQWHSIAFQSGASQSNERNGSALQLKVTRSVSYGNRSGHLNEAKTTASKGAAHHRREKLRGLSLPGIDRVT